MATLRVCDICGCNSSGKWINASVSGFPLPKKEQEEEKASDNTDWFLFSYSNLFNTTKSHKEFNYELCITCGKRLVHLLESIKQKHLQEAEGIEYLTVTKTQDNPWVKMLKGSIK